MVLAKLIVPLATAWMWEAMVSALESTNPWARQTGKQFPPCNHGRQGGIECWGWGGLVSGPHDQGFGSCTVGHSVTGKSQFWLHVGSVSLTLTLLFIAFVIIIIHNGLPQGNLPLCLNVKLSAFVQLTGRLSNPAHLWVAVDKKKLTHPLPNAGQARQN